MTFLANNFGARLKQARLAAGLTQASLAELVGVKQAVSVARWESGERQPDYETLERLASILDRPPHWFFEDSIQCSPIEPTPPAPAPSEAALMEALLRQQQLLAEQQAMMERQRADIAKLTELLGQQQAMLERQQEVFIAERQWQQRQVTSELEKLRRTVEVLQGERGTTQLLHPPARPGRAGEGA